MTVHQQAGFARNSLRGAAGRTSGAGAAAAPLQAPPSLPPSLLGEPLQVSQQQLSQVGGWG